MKYIEFITQTHNKTARNYLERVTSHKKEECAEVALQYGKDYWDGDRKHGYGGFTYDGRWKPVAEELIKHYNLKPDARILDIGCGKGFLLYEISKILPKATVCGIDISEYALVNAKEEIKNHLTLGNAIELPYDSKSFDFVFSINTFHNLYNYELSSAVKEMERVGKSAKHITVESYRNEREKVNLLYWQLTCRSFYTPKEWEWFFTAAGYTGDFGCIYFE